MRLIDIEDVALLKTVTDGGLSAKKLWRRINNQPTVDAVPVRHGKWIDETFKPWGLVYHPFKCNLCGEHAEYPSPYCPNCGARMDAQEIEEEEIEE